MPYFCATVLQVPVVIGIFKSALNGVMINITYGHFCSDSRNLHRFKLKIGHGPCGVLRQGLIDSNSDLSSVNESTGNNMCFNYFFGDRLAHEILVMLSLLGEKNNGNPPVLGPTFRGVVACYGLIFTKSSS